MRSGWARLGYKPNWLVSWGGDLETHTGTRAMWLLRHKSWSQGTPRIARSHQRLGDQEGLFPRTFGGSIALLRPWFGISGLQNCKNKSVASPAVGGTLLWQPQEPGHSNKHKCWPQTASVSTLLLPLITLWLWVGYLTLLSLFLSCKVRIIAFTS